MQDYSWTKVESSVEKNCVIIQGSNVNNNKKDKGDSNKDKGDQRLNVMRMKKRGIVDRQDGKFQQQLKLSNSNSSGNNNNSVKGDIKAHNESYNGIIKNRPLRADMYPPINTTQSYYNNIRPLNNHYNQNQSISQSQQHHQQPY